MQNKTAKLHRLLEEKDQEGFRLDLESPESDKLTDFVSEKEEKEVDELEKEKVNRLQSEMDTAFSELAEM